MTEILSVTTFETNVGKMQAIASERGLCAVEFMTPDRQHLLDARLQRWFHAERRQTNENSILARAREWLDAYFKGHFTSLPTIPLDARGTEFEMRVWKE